LSGLPNHGHAALIPIRSSTGEPGLFSLTLPGCPKRAFQVMHFNAPTLAKLGLFRPVFSRPRSPVLGRQARHPLPQPAVRSGRFGTHLGWPAGTQNTLAPNRKKA